MKVELNGFALRVSVLASRSGSWVALPMGGAGDRLRAEHDGVRAELRFGERGSDSVDYELSFTSDVRTRLRLKVSLEGERELFHLIPGNIHGDNNEAHVRPGEFPCLTETRPWERNRSPVWEVRADRGSHPVTMVCCPRGAIGVSVAPYSDCTEADGGFVRNGVFGALPDACGVSAGYGNDPLTFVEKTSFGPATSDLSRGVTARGTIYAIAGEGRLAAHEVVRRVYEGMRERPGYRKTYREALQALAETFAKVNWSEELQQYTNRKCRVPVDLEMKPWRAIVEIGWTGGSMMAYPFVLAERVFGDLRMPKSGAAIFDEICGGFNEASGFINDTVVNRSTKNRPAGWNESEINGWWSGFLPQTKDNHCAYTNAHAAYYLLRTAWVMRQRGEGRGERWVKTALRVLDTAVELQRADGAFGYVFSSKERKVVDWEGFAGCWFAAALPYAWKVTGEGKYREAADRALRYYRKFVRDLAAWGSPMDTYKSIDSEGNLAFIRAARLMHEFTGEGDYLRMLLDGAHYEYLWRYGFRTKPECAPLKGSAWNSCGGTITSVSNPHVHPMGVVATSDLRYLARVTGDDYHARRAEDGMAWLMNTMELYPDVVGYGCYGLLSERTCPSDGLLAEKYYDHGAPASTWWSYNAWAAGSAMEAIGEEILEGVEGPSC